MRKIRGGYVGVAAVMLVFALAGGIPAYANTANHDSSVAPGLTAVAETYVSADGVYHYAFDPADLPGAQARTDIGSPTPSGSCRFQGAGESAAHPGGPVTTIATELAFNPSDCSRVLAVATYPVDQVPSRYQDRDENVKPEVTPMVTEWIASLKVVVEDPAQIDVTSTTSKVNWTSSGGCVNSSTHHADWGWYTPTGWTRTNAHWAHGRNCQRAYTDTYGKYRNGVFCLTIDTHSEHRKTWMEGRPGGATWWQWDVEKWGGCSGLLHYEHSVTTP